MELTSVVAALEILSKASKALDSLREQSKTSKDVSLKENISKLYDDFLDLKAAILRLTKKRSMMQGSLAAGVKATGVPDKARQFALETAERADCHASILGTGELVPEIIGLIARCIAGHESLVNQSGIPSETGSTKQQIPTSNDQQSVVTTMISNVEHVPGLAR